MMYPPTLLGVLKNIHRSKDDMWWTQSCLRLRDFECTKEDWDWWRKHELSHHGHFNEEQKRYFEEEALWLCARCEDVGHRNGKKLAEMAKKDEKLVHRIHALHSKHKNAKKMAAAAFDGIGGLQRLVGWCAGAGWIGCLVGRPVSFERRLVRLTQRVD